MPDTTSELFRRLRGRESGRNLLIQKEKPTTCSQLLLELLETAGLTAPEWMTAADVSKSYGYQILRGERVPGRDILLRTALSLGLSLKETQGRLRGPLPQSAPGRRRDLCAEPEDDLAAGGGTALLPAGAESLCRGALIWGTGNSFCGSIRSRYWTP